MEGLAVRPVGGGRRSGGMWLPASTTCLVLLLAMAAVEQAEAGLVQLGRRRTSEEVELGGFGGGSGRGSLFDQSAARLQPSGLVRFSDGPGSFWPAKEVDGDEEREVGAMKRLTVPVQLQKVSGKPVAPFIENKKTVAQLKKKKQQRNRQSHRDHQVGEEACGPVIPALETPACHVEADGEGYQLRKYPGGRFWTVARVENAINYDLAVLKGFLACFNYISGHNSRNEVIEMTGPVRIEPMDVKTMTTSNVKTVSYKVAFFVPEKYKSLEDLPLPIEESIISFEEFTPGVKAVYGPFGGFPDDKVYFNKWEKLKKALDEDGIKYDERTLMFAGYSSPFEFINRKQEVWVDVISSSDELAAHAEDVDRKED